MAAPGILHGNELLYPVLRILSLRPTSYDIFGEEDHVLIPVLPWRLPDYELENIL